MTYGKLAVIGLGPRGLGALEALALRAQQTGLRIAVDVFDPFPAKGAGPNFDPAESPVCLLNIPLRDIDIKPPAFSGCADFKDWLDPEADADSFPTRADLGQYLEARLADLVASDLLALTLRSQSVEAVKPDGDGWMLHADGALAGPYRDVVLTLGQPEVTPDDQLAAWQDHAAATSGAVLMQAYPASRLCAAAASWTGEVIAIRGLALSAFDIIRLLTIGQGGYFAAGQYHRSGREPACILPFSLDGKPPFPKPATGEIDARFTPLEAETLAFEQALSEAVLATPALAQNLISRALCPVVLRILTQCGASVSAPSIMAWCDQEWSSPGSQETQSGQDTLAAGIAMAAGQDLPSIGYAVGQVWRKWQNSLRSIYNPADIPPQTAAAIVGFDEGIKRYSYGPPLSSARELMALLDSGLVKLDFAADPQIETTAQGWTLESGGQTAQASVMIDGVMPSADLSIISAEPVAGLVADGSLSALQDGLAARTMADGRVIGTDGTAAAGLSLLGRLSLGSVIAADSLHDCFGRSGKRWADAVAARVRPEPA